MAQDLVEPLAVLEDTTSLSSHDEQESSHRRSSRTKDSLSSKGLPKRLKASISTKLPLKVSVVANSREQELGKAPPLPPPPPPPPPDYKAPVGPVARPPPPPPPPPPTEFDQVKPRIRSPPPENVRDDISQTSTSTEEDDDHIPPKSPHALSVPIKDPSDHGPRHERSQSSASPRPPTPQLSSPVPRDSATATLVENLASPVLHLGGPRSKSPVSSRSSSTTSSYESASHTLKFSTGSLSTVSTLHQKPTSDMSSEQPAELVGAHNIDLVSPTPSDVSLDDVLSSNNQEEAPKTSKSPNDSLIIDGSPKPPPQSDRTPLAVRESMVPKSVLKRMGGRLYRRSRSTPRPMVHISAAEDLDMKQNFEISEHSVSLDTGSQQLSVDSDTKSVPPRSNKKVTFFEPTGTTPNGNDEEETRFTRRYRRYLDDAARARRQVNIARNEAEIERRKYTSNRRLLTRNLQAMLELSKGITHAAPDENSNASDPIDDLEDNLRKFNHLAVLILDQQVYFERTANRMSKLEGQLIVLDNSLRLKEETALRRTLPTPVEDSDEDDEESDDGSNSAHSANSMETTTTVRDYYDKIGEVTLTREHIHNHDTEHLQLARQRIQDRDSGKEPELPDNQFYNQYYRDRRDLLEYYKTTKATVHALYKKNLEKSRKVEEPNLPPEDPPEAPKLDSMLLAGDRALDLMHDMAALSDINAEHQTGSSVPFDSIMRFRSTIISWIKEVEATPADDEIPKLRSAWAEAIIWDGNDPVGEAYHAPAYDKLRSVTGKLTDPDHARSRAPTEMDFPLKSDKTDTFTFGERISRRCSDPNLHLTRETALEKEKVEIRRLRKRSTSLSRLDRRYFMG